MSKTRILWADDQREVQHTLAALIRPDFAEIFFVSDGAAALEMLRCETFDILLLDLKMPPGEWGGLWLLREMRRLNICPPSIVISGEGSQTETIKALREGATDYVTKDCAEKELFDRINEVLAADGPSARLRRRLSAGEGPFFECKETLRWNVRAARFDKVIEHAVAKTLAAFMNTEGGTLAIGVKDSGEIVGLSQDKFPDHDAMLLHLDNLINTFLGNSVAPLARAHFVEIEAVEVLQIDCKISSSPVYVSSVGSDEIDLFIRRQASSVKLKLDEAVAYIRRRFP